MKKNTNNKFSYADDSTLGIGVEQVPAYSPEILHPIKRSRYRESIEAVFSQPSLAESNFGYDEWRMYELSALLPSGKPIQATGILRVRASSQYIVESKSLKLYLNSWNSMVVESLDDFEAKIRGDLVQSFGEDIAIDLSAITKQPQDGYSFPVKEQSTDDSLVTFDFDSAVLLDDLDVECVDYAPDFSLLAQGDQAITKGVFYSHLLRSNCPVTNQPDWASVVIAFDGTQNASSIASLSPVLDQQAVLRYLVSYRNHNGFHEQTVEQIYNDLFKLGFANLAVCAQYTRRGGIDITPIRTTGNVILDMPRFNRL